MNTTLADNNKYKTELQHLRDEIDDADRQILALLKRRMSTVRNVGKLKEEHSVTGSFIRPEREANMLRDMIENTNDHHFPNMAIATIWRTIIGASTFTESPLNLSIFCPDQSEYPYFLAREYFGRFVPTKVHHDAVSVLKDMEKNPHTIGIAPARASSALPCWWQRLAMVQEQKDAPAVFAVIPFVRDESHVTSQPPVLAFGRVDLAPTGEDVTLITIQTTAEKRPDNLLGLCEKAVASCGLIPASITLNADQSAALLALRGFYIEDHATLESLLQQLDSVSDGTIESLACIGAYAASITLGATL